MELPPPELPLSDDPSSTFPSDWGSLLDFDLDDLIWDAGVDGLVVDAAADHPPAEQPSQGDGGKVRKRDPRLVCGNYLAGRVPCACPEMEEEEAAAVGAKRARVAAGARCQVPGCEADISKLKGYHRRHRVCLQCANADSVVLDGEHKRYCQQCGKFHLLENFDEDKRSCRRKLERHNNRRRRKSTDTKGAVEKETSCEDTVCENEVAKDMLNGVSSADNSRCLSNQTLEAEPVLESEELLSSPLSSVPICCQNAQCQCVTSRALSNKAEHKDGKLGSMSTPTTCNKPTTYSSACPTGRISFKLYDWNPAEFPRRLRHQIFEWLASMPVELEGYIRPGCTILTVFLAMPQLMWEKLSEDGISYLKALVHTPDSLFCKHGAMVIHLNNMIFQVLNDGTSLSSVKMEVRVPNLHYVHPTCFEAGKPMVFNICGSNLFLHKFRFLVSFSGKYLAPVLCEAIPQKKIGGCCKISEDCCGGCNCDDHEILRLVVPLTKPELFGPAFIEVENESGLSNFLPVLIGDEQICLEMKIIQKHFDESLCSEFQHMDGIHAIGSCKFLYLRQTKMFQLLLDIGWVLKREQFDEGIARDIPTQVRRFNSLLELLIQLRSVAILERIMQKLVVFMGEALRQSTWRIDDGEWKKLQELLCEASVLLAGRHKHRVAEVCPGGLLEDRPLHDSTDKSNQGANKMAASDHGTSFDTQPGGLTEPLVDKKQSVNVDASPHMMHSCSCPQERLDNLVLRRISVTRSFMLTALIVTICSAVCVVLSHPDKTRKVATTFVQRLYWNSNS